MFTVLGNETVQRRTRKGKPMKEKCPVCGLQRMGNYEYCPKCGTKAFKKSEYKREPAKYDKCIDCKWFYEECEHFHWRNYGTCKNPEKKFRREHSNEKPYTTKACKHFKRSGDDPA